jgi:nicotinamide-nucleotide amidase
MLPMWQNEALPRIKARFPGEIIQARTIKTFSIQEAKVAELIHPFFGVANPTLGIYAKPDGIQVRLIAHGDDSAQLPDTAENKIKQILAPYVWGTDADTLGGIIGKTLSGRGMSLATMEDYTGGLLGNMITDDGLSFRFYRGGLITGSDLVKIGWGVPADVIEKVGSMSCGVAEAMAAAVKEKFSADFGLSITGISHKNSPAGQFDMVCIGVADPGGVKSWEQQFMWNRNDSFERAAVAALFRLRERLMELKLLDYVK